MVADKTPARGMPSHGGNTGSNPVGDANKPDLGRDRYGRQARARFRTSLLKSLWRDPLRLIKSTPKNVTIALPDTAQFIDFAQRALG